MPNTPLTNGFVFWSGYSQLDNKTPIVVIATGFKRLSSNPKTGPMIQTWILRQRIAPHVAAHTGKDTAVCGDCPLTKLVDRFGNRIRARRCYVDTSNAPNQIWKAWRAGNYPSVTESELTELFANRSVRIGAYGDPTAVPYRVWSAMVRESTRRSSDR